MALVVIDFIAAIPVFVFDRCTFLPVIVLDVRVVVVVVFGVLAFDLTSNQGRWLAAAQDFERAVLRGAG